MQSNRLCHYILLVEDDEDLRVQMSSVLQDEGFRVVTAENGQVALDFLIARDPEDLPSGIILDLMMPVMSGSGFLQRLARDYPDTFAKIPVVIATAKGSAKEELAGLPTHIGRIRKPMEIEDFIETVTQMCGAPSEPV